MIKQKNDKIYTPINIVNNMLDIIGYNGNTILNKHIIDNSCGEGSFLIEIVKRYIETSISNQIPKSEIRNNLSKFIHGIEIDMNSFLKTVELLNEVVYNYEIKDVNWDIHCADATNFNIFDYKMDFVVGNPPYIRTHVLEKKYEDFIFSKNGMTDLFIIFYEIGFKMLNKNGILCYITPRSWLTSKAGKTLRDYVIDNNLFDKIVDFKNNNPFKNVNVYPIITMFKKNKQNDIVDVYDQNFIYTFNSKMSNFIIDDKLYFENLNELNLLKEILNTPKLLDLNVKNGLSTNLDSFFYNKNYKGKYVIDAIKASKSELTKLFFPYDTKLNSINIEDIKLGNKYLYDNLILNKDKLNNRNIDKNLPWYAFGRSQGLKYIFKNKICISNLVKDINSIKISKVNAGTAVYSGYVLYSETLDYDIIIDAIKSIQFIKFIKLLGNYKQGGYFHFRTSDLYIYLNWYFRINLV